MAGISSARVLLLLLLLILVLILVFILLLLSFRLGRASDPAGSPDARQFSMGGYLPFGTSRRERVR